MQTLLTGFGPFATVIDNPAARLVERFAAETVAGHEITTCLLPTSFQRAPQLMDAALTAGGRNGQSFDLILMLGVARNSSEWLVERYGRNQDNAILDVDGYTPEEGPILPGAPDLLAVTFPVEDLVSALHRAGLPANSSDSAGGNLCNHILFYTLERLRADDSLARAGFLHVPPDERTFAPDVLAEVPTTFAQQVTAVRVVLETLAETPQAARPAATLT